MPRSDSIRRTGYWLVTAQIACLVWLWLIPPAGIRGFVPWLFLASSVALMGWSVMVLPPRTLRAHPEPATAGQLCTRGPYRLVRHPIYAALLLMAVAIVWSHPAFGKLMAALLLTGILMVKIRFEESLLRQRYTAYDIYARQTARLLPGIW